MISVDYIENIVKNKFPKIDINNIKTSLELDYFAVKKELRGKGIGKKLTKNLLKKQKKFLKI